ncbi:hypothetical protein ABZ215_29240 [Amycolatopsis sp. NPDC006131]|uniref:hypothetical protein n=1 Tax=Amycolatopsis sp. NPDC006131 TaxID=3156731 RepID=UPI0033A8E810
MRAAIEAATAAGVLTPHVGGTAKTGDVVAAVIDNLGRLISAGGHRPVSLSR